MSRPVSRILSCRCTGHDEPYSAANIHLGRPSLTASSSYLQASASNLLGLIGPAAVDGP